MYKCKDPHIKERNEIKKYICENNCLLILNLQIMQSFSSPTLYFWLKKYNNNNNKKTLEKKNKPRKKKK